MGHPGQANVRKLIVRFLGVWRRARVCVRVSYATTPERNQPHVPRWSIRPTCEFSAARGPDQQEPPREAAPPPTQQKKSSRIELAHLQKPRVRMQARPLDLRPPVSPLAVAPPACHFASCRVSCRGQSHGRGGSCHRRSHHARDSGATSRSSLRRRCRQCWRRYHHLGGCSLWFVCRSADLTQAHFPRQVRSISYHHAGVRRREAPRNTARTTERA